MADTKSRLEFLEEAVGADANNTFARYGLAMELKNSGKTQDAWMQFEYLLAHHPDYAATYAQAASLLAGMGRVEDARNVLRKGIAVNASQGKTHAREELQAALDELQ